MESKHKTSAAAAPKAARSKRSSVAESAPPAPRRRGRPSKTELVGSTVTPMISRDAILDRAVELAMVEPLSDLSIIGLARDFGVTPALIHYYAGSRDDLISGVINRYFMARVELLRPLTRRNWRQNVEEHARGVFGTMKKYGGVLRYLMSHNRFRLFQQVGAGETDYGLVHLNRVAEIFRSGGFNAEQCALGYHLLMQYVMTAAYAEVNRQLPAEHEAYILGRIQASSAEQYPAAHFFAKPFARVDAQTAFDAGLKIMLDGMQGWLAKPAKKAQA